MKRQLLQLIFVTTLSLYLIACQTDLLNDQPESYVKSTDGVSIHHTKTSVASDVTLLFIHCWGCNSSYWELQVENFAKTHQVITLDLAGHGLSGANRDEFTIEMFADDIVAVVNKLGLSNVILVGHSLGAATAIEATLKLPKQILGIVAVDTFETSYQWPNKSEINNVMIPFRKNFYKSTYPMIKSRFAPHTDKSLIYSIAKDIALAPPDIGISSLENFYQWMATDYSTSRSKLSIPLIHINSLQAKKPIDSSEHVLYVKYVGHYIPQESPKKFNEALDQALLKLNIQK